MSALRSVLDEHREELETLAKALLEYETLSGDEITRVLAGETIDRGGAKGPRSRLPAPRSQGQAAQARRNRRTRGRGRLVERADRDQQADEQADRDEGEDAERAARQMPPHRPTP